MRRPGGQYLHHNFVVALLNDLFGIQARGGCSCAGPYGHRLLGIDLDRSHEFEREIAHGCEGIKPGWVRVNFNYFLSEAQFQVLLDAIHFVAEHGWKLLPHYRFDPVTALWHHRRGQPAAAMRLGDVTYRSGKMEYRSRHATEPEQALAGYLDEARRIVDEAVTGYRGLPAEPDPAGLLAPAVAWAVAEAASAGRHLPVVVDARGDKLSKQTKAPPIEEIGYAKALGDALRFLGHDAPRGLEAAGQRVLVNDAVELRRGGAALWLVGTGDPAGLGFTRGGGGAAAPDIPRALAGVPPGAFVVCLAHNPVLWPALAGHGVRLTLSGHTHHGQLSVPRLDWSLASVFLEHAMGSHRTGDSLLYINPGTNYWGLPFRLGALPEVTVLTLRRGEGPVLRPAGEPRPRRPATAPGTPSCAD